MCAFFRTEVLLTEAIDSWLREPAIHQDFELLHAVNEHLQNLTRDREVIAGINYPDLRTSLEGWNAKPLEEFDEEAQIAASRAAWQVQDFEDAYGSLNDSFFSLLALSFVSAGCSREKILETLEHKSWATKHEILTRWGWALKHRELLRDGHALKEPYMCRVARRKHAGRRADREFYQLLGFLHFLRSAEGRELLFFAKGETPDFTLEDAKGEKVGVEMMEASISNEWDEERDEQEEILDLIDEEIRGRDVHVHLSTSKPWRALSSNRESFRFWFRSELERIGRANRSVRMISAELEIEIEVSPGNGQDGYISWSDPRGETSSDIERQTNELRATIRERIERKLARVRGGRLLERARPSIRPCYLVIYPNVDLGPDLSKAIGDLITQPPSTDVSSHFEEVWISGERLFTRLIPAQSDHPLAARSRGSS